MLEEESVRRAINITPGRYWLAKRRLSRYLGPRAGTSESQTRAQRGVGLELPRQVVRRTMKVVEKDGPEV